MSETDLSLAVCLRGYAVQRFPDPGGSPPWMGGKTTRGGSPESNGGPAPKNSGIRDSCGGWGLPRGLWSGQALVGRNGRGLGRSVFGGVEVGGEKRLGRTGCWIPVGVWEKVRQGQTAEQGTQRPLNGQFSLTASPPYPTGGSCRPGTQKQAPPH